MVSSPDIDELVLQDQERNHSHAEALFRDLLGSSYERLQADCDNPLALTEVTRFYDSRGASLDNLIAVTGSVIGMRRLDSGETEVSVYPNADAARLRQPVFKIVAAYRSEGSNYQETRHAYDLTGSEPDAPALTTCTTLNKDTGDLTISASDRTGGEQTLQFSADGRPLALTVRSPGPDGSIRTLSFTFDQDGQIVQVDLNGNPLPAEQAQAFADNAQEMMRTVAAENGLPVHEFEPFVAKAAAESPQSVEVVPPVAWNRVLPLLQPFDHSLIKPAVDKPVLHWQPADQPADSSLSNKPGVPGQSLSGAPAVDPSDVSFQSDTDEMDDDGSELVNYVSLVDPESADQPLIDQASGGNGLGDENSAGDEGGIDADLDDEELFTEALIEEEANGTDVLSGLGAPLTAEEQTRVDQLILNLGSESYGQRTQAAAALRAFGLRILPQLLAASADADPERANQARQLINQATRDVIAPVGSVHIPPMPATLDAAQRDSLQAAIERADRLATDSAFRQARQAQLEAIVHACGSGRLADDANAALAELADTAGLRATLRVRFAEALARSENGQAEARQLLLQAIQIRPQIAVDASFATAIVRAAGQQSPDLIAAFRNAGGDMRVFGPGDAQPVGQGGPADCPTWQLYSDFPAEYGQTFNMGQQQRLDYYQNNSARMTHSQRASLLLDAYVTAQDDAQRQQAEQLLRQESINGNNEASRVHERLAVLNLIAQPFRALEAWPANPLQFPDNTARRAAILEMLRTPPLDRPGTHHEAIEMILDHYRCARNAAERQEAINWLRDEVQQGNQSAALALRQLAAADAILRFNAGTNAFQQATTEPERLAARALQLEALRDLARMEYAEQRQQEGTFAGSFMEHLARSPQPGLNPLEFQREREQGQTEGDNREQAARTMMVQALRLTGTAREQALTQLRTLAEQQLGSERSDELLRFYNFARFGCLAQDLRSTLGNPEQAATRLLQLAEISATNPGAHQFMEDLANWSPEGEALVAALRSGDRNAVVAALRNSEIVGRLNTQLQPIADEIGRLTNASTGNVLELLGASDEMREQLLREAAEQEQRDRQAIDDAVHDYLLRDSSSESVRRELLAALPASGPMRLEADRDELRQLLESARQNQLLPRQVDDMVRRLLEGEALNQTEVATLRQALERIGSERRREALERINAVSRDNLGYGADYQVTLNTIQSIENARQIHEFLQTALSGGPESRQTAVQQLVTALEQLNRYATDGYHHPLSTQFLHALNQSVEGGLAGVLSRLRSGNAEQVAEGLRLLQDHMPNGEAQANEFRALRIVRDLGPSSSAEDFRNAAARLEAEIAASRGEGGLENSHAVEWQQWARANEHISALSQAGHENNAAAAAQAVRALADLARNGNRYARMELTAMMAGTGDGTRIGVWLDRYGALDGRPTYVPNLGNLSAEVRRQLLDIAADAVSATLEGGAALSEGEAAGVALALARLNETNAPAELIEKYRSILEQGLQGPNASSYLEGMMQAIESRAPGAQILADIYLRHGGIDHADFARHYGRFEELARQNSPAAIRILAAVAAGRADDHRQANPRATSDNRELNPISERALAILSELSERPGVRPHLVESLLYIHSLSSDEPRFQDRHSMMALLGTAASRLPESQRELINQARTALRQRFAETSDNRDGNSFRSAFDGMLAMARHWSGEDATVFAVPVDARIVDALRRVGDTIPDAARQALLENLAGRLTANDTSFDERLRIVQAMGAMSRYLTRAQVELLAGFGGNDRYNIGGRTGEQRLADLGITGASVREFQAECAEVLMRVLTTAPNARPGEVGPRETAYNAFRDMPWPLRDGQGGFIDGGSRNSEELRRALIDYCHGRPFDISLAGEINRIVDNARLPRPAADILRRLGIGDPQNMLDPQRLERAETIIRNYASQTEAGEEVLRRVVSNIEMLNSLPAYDRARLMGWTDLSQEEKEALGWVSEPPAEVREALGWDRMTEAQREQVRWQGARIDAVQVLGQMYNNALQESTNRVLLNNLTAQVEAMRQGRAAEVERLTNELAELNLQRRGRDGQGGTLGQLHDHTAGGASFGNQVIGLLTFNNGRDSAFEERQNQLLEQLRQLNDQIAQTQQRLGAADQHQHELALAAQVGEYHRLLNTGDQVAADRLAIQMWREHGPALAGLAPSVWRDLTVSTDNTLQGASILRRLVDRGQAQWDLVPGYAGGDPADPAASLRGFRQALGLENCANANERRGLGQLSRTELLDTAALRDHMFGRINQDATLRRFSNAARLMNGPLEELSRMFAAAQHGSIYENFIEQARSRAQIIRDQLDSITQEDLRSLQERITLMEQAAAQMRSNPNHNAEALRMLEEQIRTYKGMHNMFNRFDDAPLYPEVMERTHDDQGSVIHPYRQTRQMVDMIMDNALQPSTFTTWLAQNGPLIGATILAVAATVAACATFGVASPAAVGLWVAVAGLAAREITNEVLYHVNSGGYTGFGHYGQQGSLIGHWGRTIDQRTFLENIAALGTDVVGPYALQIGRDWLAFVATAGLSNYFFGGADGARAALASVFRSPPANLTQLAFQAERAALMANGSSAASSFMRQFLQNFGRELMFNAGFTAVQSGIEHGVHCAIGHEHIARMGEWGQFGLSFAISTGLAMGQGYRHHRRYLQDARMTAGNHMEFNLAPGVTESQFAHHMRQQGFQVRQTGPGRWEVLPFNASPGMRPIVMENAATRGQGRPPAEVTPPGETPSIRPAETLPDSVQTGEHIWRQTPEGQRIMQELRAFSEHFLNGRYGQALDLASNPTTLAEMPGGQTRTIRPYEVRFDVEGYNRAADKPAFLREFMQRMCDQAGVRPAPGGNGIEVIIPEPVIAGPGGVRINVATGEVTVPGHPNMRINVETGEVILAPGQARTAIHNQVEAAFRPFRDAVPLAQRQRIVAEQALIAMEERLHMQHAAMGERAFSARYAEFVRDMHFDSPDHVDSLTDGRGRSRSSVEQEAILALYDAGWPLSQLEHHFGSHHANVRRPVFEYLRAREAINNISNAETRALVEAAIQEATPSARRQLMQQLPDIIQRHGGLGDGLLTKIEQIRDAATLFVDGATNITQLSEMLNTARTQFPDVANDPALGRIVDQAVARAIMREGNFGNNPNAFLHNLHGVLEHFQLPPNSATRSALEQRIEGLLATNRPRAEVPIEALTAIANRFGLSQRVRDLITNYNPGSQRGMEILGRDMLDAFGQRHSEARAALDDWLAMIGRSRFTNPNEVLAGSHKPDNIGEGYFIYNISNFRIAVHIDFATGQVRPVWTGTHAEYDRAISGNTGVVRARLAQMYQRIYGN